MYRIAVLVSGGGTNLQRIIDAIAAKELQNIEIVAVIADRDCKALDRAMDHGIPAFLHARNETDVWTRTQEVLDDGIDLIVLAGFLSIIPADFILNWENKIINIHPSLLPKYGGAGMYGIKVHKAVLGNSEKETGATVHYVTARIDEGEIILQKSIKIKPNETAEWLATKVHQVEYEILVKAIKMIQNKQVLS